MRNLKRVLGLVLAMIMALALTTAAFAADDSNTTIQVNNGAESATYSLYQIMSLRQSGTGADATYSYVVNGKYGTQLLSALTTAGAANVPSSVDGLTTTYLNGSLGQFDASTTRTFANALYEQVKAMTPDATLTAAEAATGKAVAQGYYLMVENLAAGSNDMRSLVVLDTQGLEGLTVEMKRENPTVEKKVETADSTVAYVGQILPFSITANLTKYTAEYKEFNVYFEDTMGKGLTLLQDATHDIKVYLTKDGTDASRIDITNQSTIQVNGQTLKVAVRGLEQVDGIGATSKVICEYYAQINDQASFGNDVSSNTNTVVLKYSNDPYWESKGEHPGDPTDPSTDPDPDPDPDDDEPTGGTEDDEKVDIITIELDITKVDGAGDALPGADFTLYRWASEKETPAWEAVTIKPTTVTDTTTQFVFGGIGQGIYRLVESKVPAGRVPMDDKFIKVTAKSTVDAEGNTKIESLVMQAGTLATPVSTGEGALVAVNPTDITWADGQDSSITVNAGSAVTSTSIKNEAGIKLPATGGEGTTMLYVIGGVVLLVALAGCFLYMRKRNTAEQ